MLLLTSNRRDLLEGTPDENGHFRPANPVDDNRWSEKYFYRKQNFVVTSSSESSNTSNLMSSTVSVLHYRSVKEVALRRTSMSSSMGFNIIRLQIFRATGLTRPPYHCAIEPESHRVLPLIAHTPLLEYDRPSRLMAATRPCRDSDLSTLACRAHESAEF